MASEDVLGLSDADFLNSDLSAYDEVVDGSDAEADGVEDESEEVATSEDDATASSDDDVADDEDEDEDDDASANEDESEDPFDDNSDEGDDDELSDEEDDEKEKSDDEEKSDEEVTDYEAFFKKVTAEFKANGRPMKVDNPDDVVRLMQMGANYNKKMASLKPNLKVLKLLENNGLMDEEKLNYLIDLNEKRPEAIAKLLADSQIDPMDVDLEQAGNYKASARRVDEREMALDEIVDEIKDTPTFNQTLNVVSKQWDDDSKQAVAESPQLLRVINDHMASGIYDVVSTEIEKERVLGRLTGLSDIEAYQKVGDAIAARGGFDHLFQQ